MAECAVSDARKTVKVIFPDVELLDTPRDRQLANAVAQLLLLKCEILIPSELDSEMGHQLLHRIDEVRNLIKAADTILNEEAMTLESKCPMSTLDREIESAWQYLKAEDSCPLGLEGGILLVSKES